MNIDTDLILIIEGSASQLEHLERTLVMAGYLTLTARRALDGLDIARNHPIDLILTSIDLPDLSGREMATTLRADSNFDDIPIIALLDHDSPEQRELNLAAGITGFIQRPIDPVVFPIYIEFFLSGGHDTAEDAERLEVARQRYIQDVVKRLEGRIRELERKNDDLQRMDQMKDSFIQLTAHELRTPLTLVTGYTQLISDHPALLDLLGSNEDFKMLFDGLTESMERMHGIIEEVLITSRIMTSKIDLNVTEIQPGALVRRVLTGYEEAMQQRQLTLHWDEAEYPENMMADSDLLRLTIANLVSNAIKYTPNGGHIFVIAQYNASMLRLSVRDTGVGIDPNMQARIFERLHISQDVALHSTSKTAFGGGGLGLGLAICKGIVEAHGGRIQVDSPGYDRHKLPGSEFTLYLPLQTAASNKPTRMKRISARSAG